MALRRETGRLSFAFLLEGELDLLRLPAPKPQAARTRRDELWNGTCFELFWGPRGSAAYTELNVSPAGDWNLYDFDAYREGMRPAALSETPVLESAATASGRVWRGSCPLAHDGPLEAGATAVLAREDGTREYWALGHGGVKPDFHLRSSFLLVL